MRIKSPNMMEFLRFDDVTNNKNNLLKFSRISEEDIMNVFINKGDSVVTDFSTLVYYHDIPLYQKMIFRYRNESKLATRLYDGCDPINQDKLSHYFKIKDNGLIKFFSWLSNSFGVYDILSVINTDLKEENNLDHQLVKLWKINSIDFYFSLSIETQKSLLIRYNSDVVTSFNILFFETEEMREL